MKIYGRSITVAINNGTGIGLLSIVEFYTTADGTVDFTQTTVTNAIAGGFSKRIYSNHVMPSEQWKLQLIFSSPVTVMPADTTLLNASALLAPGYGFADTDGTLSLSLQNLSMAAKSIRYIVRSKHNWAGAYTGSTAELAPFAASSVQIPFHIPSAASRGASDTVQVSVAVNGIAMETAHAAIICLSRSANPGALALINLSPAEVNLITGGQQQFTAVGLTADGDTLFLRPTWSTTGGTIDSTGLYTAGQTGNYIVECTDPASGVKASAAINVGAASVSRESTSGPYGFAVLQNYPNPFNPVTTIEFETPEAGDVKIKVFDLLGKELATLHEGNLTAGYHTLQFNGAEIPGGIYFLSVQIKNYVAIKKMMLVK